jgi:hypothetical protein
MGWKEQCGHGSEGMQARLCRSMSFSMTLICDSFSSAAAFAATTPSLASCRAGGDY